MGFYYEEAVIQQVKEDAEIKGPHMHLLTTFAHVLYDKDVKHAGRFRITSARLAAMMHVGDSTIWRLMNVLEKKGLLVRLEKDVPGRDSKHGMLLELRLPEGKFDEQMLQKVKDQSYNVIAGKTVQERSGLDVCGEGPEVGSMPITPLNMKSTPLDMKSTPLNMKSTPLNMRDIHNIDTREDTTPPTEVVVNMDITSEGMRRAAATLKGEELVGYVRRQVAALCDGASKATIDDVQKLITADNAQLCLAELIYQLPKMSKDAPEDQRIKSPPHYLKSRFLAISQQGEQALSKTARNYMRQEATGGNIGMLSEPENYDEGHLY